MKKILIILLMCLGVSGMLSAQETGKKVLVSPEKIEFNPYWFMQVQAGAGYVVGESGFGKLISPTAALNAGYRFNKLFSLRFGLSGWESKGSWVYPRTDYKWNYLQGNVDAMIDLSSAFGGWKYDRVTNFYLFLGVGVNGAFNNDEAVAAQAHPHINFQNLWDKNSISPVGRAGIGVDFRVSQHLAINLEVNGNVLSDKYNSKKAGNVDWVFNALAGVTINFGKNHKRIPAEYRYEKPEPAPAPKPAPEPEPVPEPKPEPVVEKLEPMHANVFFVIGKTNIRDSETPKLDEFVKYMQEHPQVKAVLTGYADKQTGYPARNKQLSKYRARAVQAYLVEKGIAEDRIVWDFKGDTVQPFESQVDNRVTICIASE